MIPSRLLGHGQDGGIAVEVLEQALREVARRMPNLGWVIIASLDGVIQTTYDPFGKERPDRFLAMVSSVLALGERMFQKLQRGHLSSLTLAGDTGVLVAYPMGQEYMLLLSTPTKAEVNAAVDALTQAATVLEPASCPSLM